MRLVILLLLLSGCANKNLNPWTTVLNQMIKVSYEME